MDDLRVSVIINDRKYYYHCTTLESAHHLHSALSQSPIAKEPEIWEGKNRIEPK